ncbi:MAG: DUF805 domain-containing protein [Actinomycetota bacterium]
MAKSERFKMESSNKPILKHYVDMWSRGRDFRGRSTRAAYWSASIVNLIVSFLLGAISAAIWNLESNDLGPLEAIYSLVALLPMIALGVRRLHDVGRSGKWLWLSFTGIGIVPLMWWSLKPSSSELNIWGSTTRKDTDEVVTVGADPILSGADQ